MKNRKLDGARGGGGLAWLWNPAAGSRAGTRRQRWHRAHAGAPSAGELVRLIGGHFPKSPVSQDPCRAITPHQHPQNRPPNTAPSAACSRTLQTEIGGGCVSRDTFGSGRTQTLREFRSRLYAALDSLWKARHRQVWVYRSAQALPFRLLSKQEDQLPQNALLSPACELAPFLLFLLTGREFSPLVIIF